LAGNFIFPVFIQNKSPATYDGVKNAASCFLILKSNTPGTFRSALKNDSMALFIGAEIFSCVAFQENS